MNEGLREGGGDDSSYPSHVKSVMSFHFTLERVGETEKGAAGIDRVLAAAAAAASFSTSYSQLSTVSGRRKGAISLIFTTLLIAFSTA